LGERSGPAGPERRGIPQSQIQFSISETEYDEKCSNDAAHAARRQDAPGFLVELARRVDLRCGEMTIARPADGQQRTLT
jgi:hypothetical protein